MCRSLLAAALLLLVSCSDPTSPADDLFVTVSVTPSEIGAGEVATVVVTVANRGSRTHSLPNACDSPFDVSTEDGSVVGPPPIYCTLVPVPPTTLPARDELTFIAQWRGDGFGNAASQSDGPLPPGVYLLRGSVYADGQSDPVTGPPVAITISN